jgi:hypothetical protein
VRAQTTVSHRKTVAIASNLDGLGAHFMRVHADNQLSATHFVKMGYDLSIIPPHYLLPQLSISLNSRPTPPGCYCVLAAQTADFK